MHVAQEDVLFTDQEIQFMRQRVPSQEWDALARKCVRFASHDQHLSFKIARLIRGCLCTSVTFQSWNFLIGERLLPQPKSKSPVLWLSCAAGT